MSDDVERGASVAPAAGAPWQSVMDELEAIKQKRLADLQSRVSSTPFSGLSCDGVSHRSRVSPSPHFHVIGWGAAEPGGGCPGGGAQAVWVHFDWVPRLFLPLLFAPHSRDATRRAAEEQRAAALASVLTPAARERRACGCT